MGRAGERRDGEGEGNGGGGGETKDGIMGRDNMRARAQSKPILIYASGGAAGTVLEAGEQSAPGFVNFPEVGRPR